MALKSLLRPEVFLFCSFLMITTLILLLIYHSFSGVSEQAFSASESKAATEPQSKVSPDGEVPAYSLPPLRLESHHKETDHLVTELEGLRSWVSCFQWEKDNSALFAFSFQFVEQPNPWLLHTTESLDITFWDQNGEKLGSTTETLLLGAAFSTKRKASVTAFCRCSIPIFADSFSAELGSSGLVYGKIKIPPKKPGPLQ